MIQYIIGGLPVFLFIFIIIFLIKLYIQRKKYKEEYIEKKKQQFDQDLANEAKALETAIYNRQLAQKDFEEWKAQEVKHIQEREEVAKKYIDLLEEQKQARLSAEKEAEAHGKANIETLLEQYYGSEMTEYTRSLRAVENDLRETLENSMTALYNQYTAELAELQHDVNEYREKRNSINEEILRQRALDEQQDFYRICITDDDLADIDILLAMKARLHKTSFLDKIVYDTYVAKYVKEMAKRVLAGRDPSGIYKVTNIQTHEIYIGKSTTVASRWTNHCKSAFGLEGVADSQFQRALKKYGVQSFTWELIEEVPKDKLTEREKFYITFYDTVTYGYNQKVG